MREFKTSYRMPYSAADMFALAANIEAYPDFLPLCEKAVIHEKNTLPDGREWVKASLIIGYEKLGLNETFLSEVTLNPSTSHILCVADTGPVKQLRADWRFVALSEKSSRIDFHISYRMRSSTLQMIMAMTFDKVFEKVVQAFRTRADQIYQDRTQIPPRSLHQNTTPFIAE